MRRQRWLAYAGVLGVLLTSQRSEASPWTLPEGRGVFWTGFSFQTADREFLDEGGAQVFPLAGNFSSSSLTVGGRLGITDRLEFEISVPLTLVSYRADPVILLDAPPDEPSPLDFFQENVIDLSQTRAGVADIRAAGRYRIISGPLVLTAEVGVKIPTGYEGPAGTFGERPETQEEFLENVDVFVAPENVRDDVTLGDAQVDLHGGLLLGYALSSGTFFRLSGAYRLRLGGAGDQVTGLGRVGQAITRRFLVYGGAEIAYSIQDGRVIGISVAAQDPTLPATEYGGTTNLLLREIQLVRNELKVGGGLILRATDRLEFNAGYDYTVWGRNTAAIHAASMSLALRVEVF